MTECSRLEILRVRDGLFTSGQRKVHENVHSFTTEISRLDNFPSSATEKLRLDNFPFTRLFLFHDYSFSSNMYGNRRRVIRGGEKEAFV